MQAEAPPEAKLTGFEKQNPASKKLAEEVKKVLDEALDNLAEEVKSFLEKANQH